MSTVALNAVEPGDEVVITVRGRVPFPKAPGSFLVSKTARFGFEGDVAQPMLEMQPLPAVLSEWKGFATSPQVAAVEITHAEMVVQYHSKYEHGFYRDSDGSLWKRDVAGWCWIYGANEDDRAKPKYPELMTTEPERESEDTW